MRKAFSWAAAAALAGLLSGCGSGDGGDDDRGHATQAPRKSPADSASGDPASARPSEPAERLTYTVGEESEPLTWREEGDEGERAATATIRVTVDSVTTGQHSDLQGYFEPADVKGLRPAFVRLSVEHVDGDPLEYTYAGSNVTLLDASGQQAQTVLSAVPFDIGGACPSDKSGMIERLDAREVETRCETLLVSEASDPAEVNWYRGPGNSWYETEDNITWTVPATS